LSRKLIKSGLIVSIMTLVSRVLGLIRDIVIANVIGAGVASDVFFFANKIPSFLRRLFAEGAFAQAFVPVLSEYHEKDGDKVGPETRLLIAQVSGTLGVLVTLVTLVGVLASPIFVVLFGFSWFWDWLNDGPKAEQFELASLLLKITFPYLFFVSFTALAGAILNTIGKFAVSSFTPVLLNVSIIGCALYLSASMPNPVYALAIGVFIGGVMQFLFQIPFLIKAGALVKPKWAWKSAGVTKIRKLIVPALFGVSVTQINLLLDTLIAAALVTGSISWLYYSNRLLEFPLGLFGIGIATVILPSLSKLHTKKNTYEFRNTVEWGLKVVSLLGWPALAGLMVLAQPIVMVLFMRGEFTEQTVLNVSYALFAYLAGLISFMFIKILAPAYYARQDIKTPVKIGIKAMVANIVFNIMLAPFFGYVGLAIATTLSASLNAFLLYRGLKNQAVFSLSGQAWWFMARIIISAGIMGAIIFVISPPFAQWLTMTKAEQLIQLAICIGVGVITYFISLVLIGIRIKDVKVQA